ncbi:inositol monophosphatase family protein [Streptosporangium sp. NPDC000396]|uniref:inositol monophosphatase family protein n=1 Tax=Streptosporangium sp. NPDC000396 TaxID=3366185 RepID=UPI0036B8690F
MHSSDQAYCQDLLRHVGRAALDEWRRAEPPADLASMVTRYHAANDAISARIGAALADRFPAIGFTAEELEAAAQGPGHDYWICDPLDGVANFVQGFGPWCITLTLISGGTVRAVFIYDPMNEEIFTAAAGGGAYLNGEPIRTGRKTSLDTAVIATAHSGKPGDLQADTPRFLATMERLTASAFCTRVLGPASLQLAYVACGRLDGYCEHGQDINDWLGAALLAAEAGATVTAADGTALTLTSIGVVAANPGLHPELLALQP